MKHVAAALACLTLMSPAAQSHKWYSGSRNPVTGSSCCGKADCIPLSPNALKTKDGNYVFKHSGQWYSIPFNQALPSQDSQSHGCVWGLTSEGGPSLCIFIGGAT